MAPNIVWFVADDQPKGCLDAMPVLQSEIINKGVYFNNFILPTSLCAPSRAAMWTGNYAHTSGVWTNKPTYYGSWTAFARSEDSTLATHLKAIGYHTVLLGKYTNKFSLSGPTYVPPGWDVFRAIEGADDTDNSGTYYGYRLRGTSPDEFYAYTAADYSTDVIAAKAISDINAAPAGQPLYLHFAPFSPHGPYEAAPRYVGTWPQEANLPGFNEADMSDKPKWMQDLTLVSDDLGANALTKIHESIRASDDALNGILNALTATGRLSNTIFVFSSDNGRMMGVHRVRAKDVPHRMSTEVDCAIRWDGHITQGSTNDRVTPQIDVTAWLADQAGVTGWTMDGKNWETVGRAGSVVEQMDNDEQHHPAYVGFRTGQYLYVEYTKGEALGVEMYDYNVDPYELDSKDEDPAYASIMEDLRAKALAQAQPAPPGFEWRGNRAVCVTPDSSGQPVNPPPGGRFTGDPGPGKILLSWNSLGGDWGYHHSFRDVLRGLSAGANWPARTGLNEGCYRAFYNGMSYNFGSASDGTWSELRQAAANCRWVSVSFDANDAASAANVYNGTNDSWITNSLAPAIKDFYNSYGVALDIDLNNEPDQWDSGTGTCSSPLTLARLRRAARYLHFKLLSITGVTADMFFIGTPTNFNETGRDHATRAAKPIRLTETNWSSTTPLDAANRGDAIYYYYPDWKGTKTVANGFWTDAWDPNPDDFYLDPTVMDEWGYGKGPVCRVININSYDKSYEHNPGFSTQALYKAAVTSTSDRAGGHFRFNRALWGPSTNDDGLPVNIGEWGYGVWTTTPTSATSSDPDVTADAHANFYLPDLVANNVIAMSKWRHVQEAYDSASDSAANADTFTFHYVVGAGTADGTHKFDTNNANSKGFAQMWSRTEVAGPGKAPDGTDKPLATQHN